MRTSSWTIIRILIMLVVTIASLLVLFSPQAVLLVGWSALLAVALVLVLAFQFEKLKVREAHGSTILAVHTFSA